MIKHLLRDYQNQIIQRIEEAIAKGYRRIMLQLPTGAGKTRCFVELAKRHKEEPYVRGIPNNCLVVAHRKELIDQAVDALGREIRNKWEIGVIRSKVKENRHSTIQVASIQSLIRRDFPKAGLVIIDEAHHATAESYQKIIDHYRGKSIEDYGEESIILGVTATPARTDGKGFRDSFQILIKGPTIKKLTVKKYLCPYKLYAYNKQRINTSSVKIQAGDYEPNQLADVVSRSQVRADLVQTWQQYAFEKRTVVFAVNVELSKQYAEIYNASGYKAEHIDGTTLEQERAAILKRFAKGQTKILCNCNIVTEGFDLPEMECVQIVRPTQSVIFWLQMVGRSLRTSKDKTHAIILDHTDNYQRLGLPDSEHNWSLDGIKPVGFVPNSTGSGGSLYNQRRRDIQHIEGELIEIYSNSTEVISENQEHTQAISPLHIREAGHKMINKMIIIGGEKWTVNSELADILSEKFNQLNTLQEIVNKRNTDFKNVIDDAQDRINTHEQSLKKSQEEISRLRKLNEQSLKKSQEEISRLRKLNEQKEPLNPIPKPHKNKEKEDDSNTPYYYHNGGINKYISGDKAGAVIEYTRAISLDPNNAEFYHHRGVVLLDLGDKNEALANLRKAAILFHKSKSIENYKSIIKLIEEVERL